MRSGGGGGGGGAGFDAAILQGLVHADVGCRQRAMVNVVVVLYRWRSLSLVERVVGGRLVVEVGRRSLAVVGRWCANKLST